jgi:hypothetical protein
MMAGPVGLAIGYYVLLWLGADFLNVAPYLPNAVLPPAYRVAAPEMAAQNPPTRNAPESLDAHERASEVENAAEIHATYTTPAVPAESTDSTQDQSDAPNRATQAEGSRVTEPQEFNQPKAAPLSNAAAALAELANRPSFTADQLAIALRDAQVALPGLMAGDLKDGREVRHAKGFSYSLLCDLAQKVAFVDASQEEYATALSTEADALFHKTLADPHTREEVARILPQWISSKRRLHGGVFFAGALASKVEKGGVAECQFDLGDQAMLTVIVPAAKAGTLVELERPLGVVGWIVDKPADQSGFTGEAPQAIWAARLIPLD